MALFILDERKKPQDQQKFGPYLDICPTNFDHFPIFFTQEEVELLKGTQFITFLDHMIKEFYGSYHLICKLIPQFGEKYTIIQYLQARLLSLSRSFKVNMEGKNTSNLLPMVDVFNHTCPPQLKLFYDQDKKVVVLEALKDIA